MIGMYFEKVTIYYCLLLYCFVKNMGCFGYFFIRKGLLIAFVEIPKLLLNFIYISRILFAVKINFLICIVISIGLNELLVVVIFNFL
jgi:hypothetical protein